MVKNTKASSFYTTFERKGPGQKVTHYCPGCGHGNAHKIIAEAIDDFGIQDRTVFLSPVGCAAFAYYYFDTGNISCAHGRAPAVGTGVVRNLRDAIVISYQGDGDLAGIGTAEIVHAANRGENMAVIFINNAIYGMTGGQMAPTTLEGQKTATTPKGRASTNEGGPIRMCEVLNDLEGPAFIERVSLADASRIMKARKAIRKAIKNQVDHKGFSFVEVLSPCPVGWKMSEIDARNWLKENMEEFFPVQNFRDREGSPPTGIPSPPSQDQVQELIFDLIDVKEDYGITPREEKIEDQLIKIAGFGGQGVMSAGILLANCAIAEGFQATWLPSYGPEMRGGTANASVVLSNEQIGSPVVDEPTVLFAMNAPSLDSFEDTVQSGGTILVNSSLISRKVQRDDVRALYIPATEMAKKEGFIRGANIIMITVYMLLSEVIQLDTFRKIIPLSIKKREYMEINLNLIEVGKRFYEENI
jgi:2-oxoisovalerate ferredoxin oxidoreductase beta subunit